MDQLLPILLLAPFVTAIVALFVTEAKAARGIALVGAGVALAASVLLYLRFDPAATGYQFERDLAWLPALSITLHLGVDGISLGLVLLTTFVGFCAVLAGGAVGRHPGLYYAMLLTMIGATAAAFVSLNLFFFYFFAEVATLPKYLLTGVWGRNAGGSSGRGRAFAAIQQTIFIGGGALLALVALIALYFLGGKTLDVVSLARNIASVGLAEDAQRWLFGALLFGFGTWVSLVPLHAWSPTAYAAAPTGAAMFFAGVSKKVGAYGLLRIGVGLLPAGAHAWADVVAVLAAVNIVYAGWVSMKQTEWQPLIGYSSVSHAGYMFLGLAALTPAALNGFVLFMVAHGLMTALLFAAAGSVSEQTGTREIRGIGGLAQVMPFVALMTAFGVLASSGVPGFANFASELMIFVGAWASGSFAVKAATVAAIWGLVITATYLLRALRDTFYGPLPARQQGLTEKTGFDVKIATVALVLALLALGVQPRLLTDGIKTAVAELPTIGKSAAAGSNAWKAQASRNRDALVALHAGGQECPPSIVTGGAP